MLDGIRALSTEIDGLDQFAAYRFGLNRTDLRALDIVGRAGSISPTAVAQELQVTTGGMTSVIDRLERAGYVRRKPDPADRRRLLLEVTERTNETGRTIFGPIIEATVKHVDGYSDSDLRVIADFLSRHRQTIAAHRSASAEVASA